MIVGIHHLGLTVSDVERSADWYESVLGFGRIGSLGDATTERRKIFLGHPGFDIRIGLVEHNTSSKAPFDETETGLDHLSFEVVDTRRARTLGRPAPGQGRRLLPRRLVAQHSRCGGVRVPRSRQHPARAVHRPDQDRPLTQPGSSATWMPS